MSVNWPDIIANIIGSAVGALIAVAGSILIYNYQKSKEKKEEEKNKEKFSDSVVCILQSEINYNREYLTSKNLIYSKSDYIQYDNVTLSNIKLEDYDKIKFELINYLDMHKIQKIIKLYDKLYKLQKNGDDTEGIIILKFWKTELEKEFDELSN